MKKIIGIILAAMLLVTCAVTVVSADNDITVLVNEKAVEFDVVPQIINERTMVPLRAIFEALGATVGWDDATKTVTSELSGVKISLAIGSNQLYVNGTAKEIDVPAMIIDERTLVPVRAISEAFGCEVGWDGETKTVSITFITPEEAEKIAAELKAAEEAKKKAEEEEAKKKADEEAEKDAIKVEGEALLTIPLVNCTEKAFVMENGIAVTTGAANAAGQKDPIVTFGATLFKDIDAGKFKRIRVGLYYNKNEISDPKPEIYFITPEAGWAASRRVEGKAITEADEKGVVVYEFDCSANAEWTGTISNVRFDPFNDTRKFGISFIQILP